MADDSDKKNNDGGEEEVEKKSTGEGEAVVEVNMDELSKEEQDAPTEAIDDLAKTMDANKYATKKTVAQGMLDIALLTSNASQLKYVLQVGPKHEFYMLLVILISISIVLQVMSALVLIVLGAIFDINHQPDQKNAELLNNITLGFKTASITVNIFIGIFYSLAIDNDAANGLATSAPVE